MWKALISRMESRWAETTSYMVYEYLNLLTVRDAIEDYQNAMLSGLRSKYAGALAGLDRRYQAVTVDDSGAELAQYWRPLAESRESRWWWTRKPSDIPPGW